MSAPPPPLESIDGTTTTMKPELTQVKGLPPGWKREVVVRKNGLSAGKTDVYYYSPCGKKFRSKPQIARFLGESVDLACFDFSRAGTPGDGTQRRRARDRSSKRIIDLSRPTPLIRPLSINPLRPSGPIRRTCGVIKLPVTLVVPPSEQDLHVKNSQLSLLSIEAKASQQQQQQQQQGGAGGGNGGLAVQASWERKLLGVKAYDHESGSEIELSSKPPLLQNGMPEGVAMELSSSSPSQPLLKPNGVHNPEQNNNLQQHHQNGGGSQIRSLSPPSSAFRPWGGVGGVGKQQQLSSHQHQQPQAAPTVAESLSLLQNRSPSSSPAMTGSNSAATVQNQLSEILLSLKQQAGGGGGGVSLPSQLNGPVVAASAPSSHVTGTAGGGGGVAMVTDKDLRLQEEKVRLIRRQLMVVQGTS